MKDNKIFEVHWITYPRTGEQGWATVNSENYNDWIFYGNDTYYDADLSYSNGFEHACYQAKLTNSYNGIETALVIKGIEESVIARYKPYQWMEA